MLRLDGKVCIVTGGGARGDEIGNGRATAIAFAREGARVLVNDLDATAAERTVEMITDEGGEAASFVGDLTDRATAERMVDTAVDRWGRLDVLHNNVGITVGGTVVDVTEATWDRVMEVNVKTMMLACKAAVGALERSGGGCVINISSISALRPRGLTPYTASKGAVIALTEALAIDHASAGIRANCVAPGPIYTPHVAGDGMSDDLRERRRRASPLGIEGSPWDVAHTAVFLASEEARYITGVTVPVDGGVILTSAAR
ncbi:SDR family oxidoreductase [Spiractinospora alimapuensis]|uniref:SDR family NAD(P)-dependent oxidoreductase n=1 Tax=Spiractinospora alimapuensis TaxID=2820884 RepID=UPI001F229AC2|nr:SDR family NAD(P)-dependent oxidoreductase [Spiractinospora alimapuensis]QVQ52273.1 SDR family oxidoreductase [Spiractinospora alimapuensis]